MGRTKNSGLSIGTRGNPQLQLQSFDLDKKLATQAAGCGIGTIGNLNELDENLDFALKNLDKNLTYFLIVVLPHNEIKEKVVLNIQKKFNLSRNVTEKILFFGGIIYKGTYSEIIGKIQILDVNNIKYRIEII